MKWSYPVVVFTTVVLGASSAFAQTSGAQTPAPDASPSVISCVRRAADWDRDRPSRGR